MVEFVRRLERDGEITRVVVENGYIVIRHFVVFINKNSKAPSQTGRNNIAHLPGNESSSFTNGINLKSKIV